MANPRSSERRAEDATGFASLSVKGLVPERVKERHLPDIIQHMRLKGYGKRSGRRVLFGEMLLAYIQEHELDSSAGLQIVNDIDDEPCPQTDWLWSSGHKVHESVGPPKGLEAPEDMCCDCPDDECDPKTCSCYRVHEKYAPVPWKTEEDGTPSHIRGKFAYDKDGRLTSPDMPGTPIWECNSRCSCSSTCPNRVVQKGRRVWLQLAKTQNMGWGIRAGELIPRGTFVCCYAGELMTREEADRRGATYDQVGSTYLLTLDSYHITTYLSRPYRAALEAHSRLNGRKHEHLSLEGGQFYDEAREAQPDRVPGLLEVDAALYGNLSRYFNHSCEPNLAIWPVYPDAERDIRRPTMTFFTRVDVPAFEQLTFSYSGVGDGELAEHALEKMEQQEAGSGEAADEVKLREDLFAMKCQCGARNCRGIVFRNTGGHDRGIAIDSDESDLG